MPETLFETLPKLVYAVQKNLSVRTLMICNAKQLAGF